MERRTGINKPSAYMKRRRREDFEIIQELLVNFMTLKMKLQSFNMLGKYTFNKTVSHSRSTLF